MIIIHFYVNISIKCRTHTGWDLTQTNKAVKAIVRTIEVLPTCSRYMYEYTTGLANVIKQLIDKRKTLSLLLL